MCARVYTWACTSVKSALGAQKNAWLPGASITGSCGHWIWGLGTKLGSPAEECLRLPAQAPPGPILYFLISEK